MARADLPHEVIEGDYGPRDIERGVKHIRKVVTKRIRPRRVEDGTAFLVAHLSTWLWSQCLRTQSRRRRVSGKGPYIRDTDPVTSPVVVDAERDKAQHGDVKDNVPTRVYATPTILIELSEEEEEKQTQDVPGKPVLGVKSRTCIPHTIHLR